MRHCLASGCGDTWMRRIAWGEGCLAANMVINGLGWYPSKPSVAYGQSLWRFINNGWGRFYHHFSFEVGVGYCIFFWHDCWCQEGPLRDLFPLFMCLLWTEMPLWEIYPHGLGAVLWSPLFVRDAFVDDTSLATFLNKLKCWMRLHPRMQLLGISTLQDFSLLNLII